MTPQDTPPPLDLDDIMDAVEAAEDANHEYQNAVGGSIEEAKAHVRMKAAREAIGKAFEDLRIENARLRGVDQGNGVREAETRIAEACQIFDEWADDEARGAGEAFDVACQMENALRPEAVTPSPSEAKQSKAPTPNPKAKDGEA